MSKLSPVPSTPVVVAHENTPSLTPWQLLYLAVMLDPSCQIQECVAFSPSSRLCSMVALFPGWTLTTPDPLAPPALLVTQLLRIVTFLAAPSIPPVTRQPSMTVLSAVTV